jgi:Leucine-rich repeat (LRR) protein
VEALWDAFDEDGSGFLEKGEGDKFFGQYCKSQGCPAGLTPTLIESLWKQYDIDGDGRLSKEELLGTAVAPAKNGKDAKKEGSKANTNAKESATKVKMTKNGKLAIWSQDKSVRTSVPDGALGWPVEMAASLNENRANTCRKLHAGDCAMGDDGLLTLASALRETSAASLLRLNLRKCKLRDAGLRALFRDGVVWQNLEKLQLSHNKIGNDGLAAIGEALSGGRLPALTMLYLEFNEITDSVPGQSQGLEKLHEGLLAQLKLKIINLGYNHITKISIENSDPVVRIMKLGGIGCDECAKQIRREGFECNVCDDFDICAPCQAKSPHEHTDMAAISCSDLDLEASEFSPQFGGADSDSDDSDSDDSSSSSDSDDGSDSSVLFAELAQHIAKMDGEVTFADGMAGLSSGSYSAFVQFSDFLKSEHAQGLKRVTLTATIPFIGANGLFRNLASVAELRIKTAAPGGVFEKTQFNGQLIASTLSGPLKKLSLSGYKLADDGLDEVASALAGSKLESLDMRNFGATRKGMGALVKAVNGHPTLKELHIVGDFDALTLTVLGAVSGLKFTHSK